MAIRMQQRRGTAAQWAAANGGLGPVLAAGEIGFETDTGKFKMGNGSSTWNSLSYFTDASDFDTASIMSTVDSKVSTAINNILDGAPAALNTLNELAAAIDNNSTFATAITTALSTKATITQVNTHEALTTGVHGIADTSALATKAYADNAVSSHEADTTSVHGIADTSALATKSYADNAVSTHEADTTSVHGIADTSALATKAYADNAVSTHEGDSTNVHGIADTAALATKAYADQAASSAVALETAARSSAITEALSSHGTATVNIHGIADTAALATKTYADTAATTAVSAHNGATTNVHGIADTANLVTLAGTQTLTNKTITSPSGLVKADVGLANVDNTSDADKPVSTAAQTELNLKAPLASPTFTGTVTTPLSTAGYVKTNASGVLSSSAAIAQADVTSLTTDLAAKAPLASPALTGTPTAPTASAGTNTTQIATTAFVTGAVADLIASAPGALNTLDELAAALGDDANFATTVTNSLTAKAPLASPTFTGTVTLPAAGIVFSDGTQAKAGVPSITTFATEISSSATLAAGEQDKFVPLSGAVTITLPASGYSTGQSIDFYQASGTGAQFASTNSVVGTPGLKFRTTNSVATALKTSSGWLVFGDLSA
jgi:hypothetical protein